MRFLIAAFCLAFAAAAPARAADLYTVTGVEIDATAGNALEAQSIAMRAGQFTAARMMIERLTLPEDRAGTGLDGANPLSGAEVSSMMAGFEISEEQRSSTRYLARLAVTFDPGAVRRVINSYGVPFVEAQARTRLVLPVYAAGGSLALWEENPWGNAWLDNDFSHALTPMIAIDPEVGGASLVRTRDAIDLNEAALRELAALYGVSRLAILRAQQAEGGSRFGGYLIDIAPTGEFTVETWGPQTVSGSWAAAARSFVASRERLWKDGNIVRDRSESEMRLTVLYSGIAEWRGLQTALSRTSLIANARLDALSRDGALMTVHHRGDPAQLASELAERGATLEEQPGLGWVLMALN